MPLPTLQHTLVIVIIVPTFLVFVFYLVGCVQDLNSKWRANKERRQQRRAAHNVRLSFDSYGFIVKDVVDQIKNHEIWERIIGNLHALGRISLSNLDMMRHHSTLRSAMDDADKQHHSIHDALARKSPDTGLMSTLRETDALLEKLRNRELVERDTIYKTLNKFEGELKRVSGQKHTAVSMGQKVLYLEPTKPVQNVNVRRAGLLHRAVDLRDRFDIGSRRVALAIINLVLTVGLVRFMGFWPALIVGGFLALEVLLDLLQACEYASFRGFMKTLKVSWAGRISAPIIIALMLANFLLITSNPRPLSNAELQDKGTFLEPPPQYRLEEALSQTYYVPAIFGVMHGTLLVLILVPLPLCYRLQTILVTRCPRLRFLVPENPVWLHRMLGYAMLSGLVVGAAIWIVFQSLDCLVFDKAFACIAFDPPEGPGLDVFRLRFLIVWPFTFFFVPLMASPTYPDVGDGASETVKTGHKAASLGGGCPFSCFSSSDREKVKAAARSCTAQVCGALKWMWNFTAKRVVDIFLVAVPFAGILLTLQLDNFFLSWYIVTPVVCVHMLVKLRSWRFKLWSPLACLLPCLDHSNEGPELFQRFWWELAYAFHATAFSLVIAAALLIRGEIFFVCLPTWGLYFVDRGLMFLAGCRNTAPIIVGSGQSSCVITKGEGADAQPAYVRLIVKKPERFEYKAGQWAHVGFNRCGSYRFLPRRFPLALQWHAFSIASSEHDDFLEFHIGVHGNCNLVKDDSLVVATKQDKHYAKISRSGYWLDWLFPFYTPFFGNEPSTSCCGSSFNAKSSGIAMTLTSPGASVDAAPVGKGVDGKSDGWRPMGTDKDKQTVRVMKPQAQWTGKLFNAISWLQDRQSRGEDISGEFVQIMGPYGTLPFVEKNNGALMLIGAGVGFPSIGAMLRKILQENVNLQPSEQKPVCFIWTATKLEQLLLCFPGLLSDLARYVHKSSLANLKGWLTVKIFISSFDPGKYLSTNPSRQLLPEERNLAGPLSQVKRWLLGQELGKVDGFDCDGTYIAQGSLGGSFADIFRNSLFIKEVIERKRSLGVCFCGPSELCSWLRTDISNTILPIKVEFASEVA